MYVASNTRFRTVEGMELGIVRFSKGRVSRLAYQVHCDILDFGFLNYYCSGV